MNITPVGNTNVSMQGKEKNPNWIKRQIRRVSQKLLDMTPVRTSKESSKSIRNWDKWTYITSDPMWNRGIMGATALLTQPTIDYYNHRVDEETRTVSRNRTIAKIVAGTLVGMFVVRGPVYKAVEKMTNPFGNKKYSKYLLPKEFMKKLSESTSHLKNYRAALSMLIALAAMSVTNFVLDAPLTVFFTNILNEKSGIKNKENSTTVVKEEING